MENKFNFPNYTEAKYKMNAETGYYEKQPEKIAFNKLPFELKVEVTMEEKIRSQGAKEIIHGRKKDNKYLFFTGLIPTGLNDCYVGNDYEYVKGEKKLSLVIFRFTEANSMLTLYYFNRYYKESREQRERFVLYFLNQ